MPTVLISIVQAKWSVAPLQKQVAMCSTKEPMPFKWRKYQSLEAFMLKEDRRGSWRSVSRQRRRDQATLTNCKKTKKTPGTKTERTRDCEMCRVQESTAVTTSWCTCESPAQRVTFSDILMLWSLPYDFYMSPETCNGMLCPDMPVHAPCNQ